MFLIQIMIIFIIIIILQENNRTGSDGVDVENQALLLPGDKYTHTHARTRARF